MHLQLLLFFHVILCCTFKTALTLNYTHLDDLCEIPDWLWWCVCLHYSWACFFSLEKVCELASTDANLSALVHKVIRGRLPCVDGRLPLVVGLVSRGSIPPTKHLRTPCCRVGSSVSLFNLLMVQLVRPAFQASTAFLNYANYFVLVIMDRGNKVAKTQ